MNKIAVIVDAYSTGARLAPGFRSRGILSLHVQSMEEVLPICTSSFRPEDFIGNIIFHGDVARCINEIKHAIAGNEILCVTTGSEFGVELADKLAMELGFPGNAADTSICRRNKYEMAMALSNAGLAAAKSIRSGDIDFIINWATGNGWPLVLKPLDSGGNDNVFFCNDIDELRNAFFSTIGSINKCGHLNSAVLVQTYLKGSQYVVNSVSIDGMHYFSDIWLDNRKILPGASNVYDYEDLLPAEGPIQKSITDYTRRALDALGIRNGPAHSEVMLTAEGPVLIETGARLQGSMFEQPVLDALGASQVSLTIDRYCDPEDFLSHIQKPYELRKYLMCVALISDQAGTVEDVSGFDQVSALESYAGFLWIPQVGQVIARTKDIFTIPGVVYLSHSEREQMQRDYEFIRSLERTHSLFSICEKTPELLAV